MPSQPLDREDGSASNQAIARLRIASTLSAVHRGLMQALENEGGTQATGIRAKRGVHVKEPA